MTLRKFPFSLPLFFESLATIGLGLLLIGALENATIPMFNWFGYYLIVAKSIEIVGFFVFRKFPPLASLLIDFIILFVGVTLIQLNRDVLQLIFALSNYVVDARVTVVFFSSSILLIALMLFVQAARGGGWGSALLGVVSLIFGIAALNVNSTALESLFIGAGGAILFAGVLGMVAAFFDPYESMSPVVAMFRLLAILLVLLRSLGLAFLAWLTPLRWRGLPIHFWLIQQMCQSMLRLLHVRLRIEESGKVRHHAGIVFVNHLSYLDILILMATSPGRFLSTAEVFSVPLLGLTASSVKTVFVQRARGEARTNIRQLIGETVKESPHPPFFIFPEGEFGEPQQVRPFRHGSFEIVVNYQIPYLLCAIAYEPVEVVRWRGKNNESFFRAFWRLLRYRKEMTAWLRPLQTITPNPNDDPVHRAEEAEHIINTALHAMYSD